MTNPLIQTEVHGPVLEIMLNPYSDFTRGLSSIRAWYTMDVALRYPAAFTYDSTVA